MTATDPRQGSTTTLDPTGWEPLAIPLGEDDVWTCEEPSARTRVAGDAVEIAVDCFERAHDHVQILDNPKHLLVSSEPIPVPTDRPVTFHAEMAAENVGGNPHDFRDGFAAFNVLDMASGLVLDHAVTSVRTWAIKERLLIPGMVPPEEAFTWLVEAPLTAPKVRPRELREFAVTLDAARGSATWWVDGAEVFHTPELPLIPDEVRLGIGLITLHPLSDAGSTSLRGQGVRGVWRNLAVTS